jgi:hypothetical protein
LRRFGHKAEPIFEAEPDVVETFCDSERVVAREVLGKGWRFDGKVDDCDTFFSKKSVVGGEDVRMS